jgi:hypothetical protein
MVTGDTSVPHICFQNYPVPQASGTLKALAFRADATKCRLNGEDRLRHRLSFETLELVRAGITTRSSTARGAAMGSSTAGCEDHLSFAVENFMGMPTTVSKQRHP